VIATELTVAAAWMSSVSEWLVASGCLYAMACGPQGTDWDSAIDDASIGAHEFGEIPPDRFVLTTWHDGETLDEVFWYCKHLAHHPDVPLERTLLLHIAVAPDEVACLLRYAAV
jgi:hypothetical protein